MEGVTMHQYPIIIHRYGRNLPDQLNEKDIFQGTKQLPDLSKCQSNDFNALMADTTISMVPYLLLILKY